MMAMVLDPPDFFPSRESKFMSSCIGTVRVAIDCLKIFPSCSSALFGRLAVLRKFKWSPPMAVEQLKMRSAVRTLVAEASML